MNLDKTPRTIAELDVELLPLIEECKATGDQQFIDWALAAREQAFHDESARWFLQGLIAGRQRPLAWLSRR